MLHTESLSHLGHAPGVNPVLDAEAIQKPEQILRGHVAGGTRSERTTTEPPCGRVHLVDPPFESNNSVGDCLAICVVEMDTHLLDRHPIYNFVQQPLDVKRGCFADGLTEVHRVDTPLHQGLGEMSHPVGVLLTLIWAVGGRGDIATNRHTAGCLHQDAANPVHRLVDSRVDVAFVEGVRRRCEDADAGHAGGKSPFEALGVRHEGRQCDIGRRNPRNYFCTVRHLGHPFGAHERDSVEIPNARGSQIVDQTGLRLRGDKCTQRLKTVP